MENNDSDEKMLLERALKIFHINPNSKELIFCYKIKFEENDDFIYINGITGEFVE